jgi:hypothetical protein
MSELIMRKINYLTDSFLITALSESPCVRVIRYVCVLHGDHLGSTSLTTNATGQPIAETRYLPNGEALGTAEIAEFNEGADNPLSGLNVFQRPQRFAPLLNDTVASTAGITVPSSASLNVPGTQRMKAEG